MTVHTFAKRINITIDPTIYKRMKAKCFLDNKSISRFITESVISQLSNDTAFIEETLSAEDEEQLLNILNNSDNQLRLTHEELKKSII